MIRSLRKRAILGGAAWALGCVLVCGGVLYVVLAEISTTRFEDGLMDRHLQVVAALERTGGNPGALDGLISDPGFHSVFSGRYWQIDGDAGLFTSHSLFDATIATPGAVSRSPAMFDGKGPNGDVRVVQQLISLEDGTEQLVLTAESITALENERGRLLSSLLISFGLVAIFGVLGAALQVSTVLRPLTKLRTDVLGRWDLGEMIDPTPYPYEVGPLIEDINTVIGRNREIISGARRQAADLAHALKTPSAIMRNELAVAASGKLQIGCLTSALDRIDAQINRSLARMRASNSLATGDGGIRAHVDFEPTVNRLAGAFRSLYDGSGKSLIVGEIDPVQVGMDRQDLEEVLGNLLDNAFKWCRSEVRLTAVRENSVVSVLIEDDGPGIPEEAKREALTAGGRLDVQIEGTGLGLAIAGDLVRAYEGSLELGKSADLGGLSVRVTVATFGRPPRRGSVKAASAA